MQYPLGLLVQAIDARVAGIFSSTSYRAVVGVSFAWPRVCVIYGYAFRDGEDEKAADEARARYIREAFSRLTVADPHRSPDGVPELPKKDDGQEGDAKLRVRP